MFLKQFPDYNWLKQQAEKAFRNGKDVQGNKMAKEGWPIVIMNATSRFCHRPDLKGPFSIFTNINGRSAVQAGGKRVTVTENSFFVSNRAQYYTLDIESETPVETFNLHLGQDAWEHYAFTRTQTDLQLLDDPGYSCYIPEAEFPNLLQEKSQTIHNALLQLYALSRQEKVADLQLQEHLAVLLNSLLTQKLELQQAIQRIPQAKQSTRTELYKRVTLVTDLILSEPEKQHTLDEMAQLACMSKFHFLRTFASIYRTTPHQFILHQKVKQAQRLLARPGLSVSEVAQSSGFEELSVFSRTFKKYTGYTPQAYRLLQ